jgi:hypothetical protein
VDKIDIQIIPHAEQRYRTVGDWWWTQEEDGSRKLHIRVSRMSAYRGELLVMIHELIEALICDYSRVTDKAVDEFDRDYEASREKYVKARCGCMPTVDSEPGDDVHAPYHHQHYLASAIERVLALALHVDWDKYVEEVNSL